MRISTDAPSVEKAHKLINKYERMKVFIKSTLSLSIKKFHRWLNSESQYEV